MARALALAVMLAMMPLGGCSRPSPLAGAGMPASQLDGAASEQQQQQQHYDRRQLLLHAAAKQQAGSGEATVLAAGADAPADAAAAQHIGLMCSYQLEQALADMAASGLRLAPRQQQEAAVEALTADVEQLAVQIVRSTAATIAALRAQLQSSMPRVSSPADIAALLHNSRFQEQLKDARDDAQLAVGAALQPHLQALAQSAHAVLGALVQAPGAMQPLPAFEEAFAPSFAHAFASSSVEATLLQALWRD